MHNNIVILWNLSLTRDENTFHVFYILSLSHEMKKAASFSKVMAFVGKVTTKHTPMKGEKLLLFIETNKEQE
jgi:hypothetical protein